MWLGVFLFSLLLHTVMFYFSETVVILVPASVFWFPRVHSFNSTVNQFFDSFTSRITALVLSASPSCLFPSIVSLPLLSPLPPFSWDF